MVKSGGTYSVFYQGSGPVRDSIGVASGPETEPIFLDADPELVTQGDQLSFATWQANPNDPAGLAVTAVDGSPIFLLLLHGKFDPCGTWRVNVPVPSGLSGLSVSLRSFALGRFTGYVLGTNTETVIFQ